MLPVVWKPCAETSMVKFAGVEFCLNWSVAVTMIGNELVIVGVPESAPVLAEQLATLEEISEYGFVAGTGPAVSAALPPARGVRQGASREAHGRAESSFAVISRKNASE